MITQVDVSKPAWLQETPPKPVENPGDKLASKETFLKLLVAQIRNQNPLEPQDGVQFVSQLAQFSGLEQSIEMRKEIEAIHDILAPKTEPTETETKTDSTEKEG